MGAYQGLLPLAFAKIYEYNIFKSDPHTKGRDKNETPYHKPRFDFHQNKRI